MWFLSDFMKQCVCGEVSTLPNYFTDYLSANVSIQNKKNLSEDNPRFIHKVQSRDNKIEVWRALNATRTVKVAFFLDTVNLNGTVGEFS
jgi:hypothetical protein